MKSEGKMKQGLKRFLAEVSEEVEEKLREEAQREKRSRNAQLAHILEQRYGLIEQAEQKAA
jgi:hypothetical protein